MGQNSTKSQRPRGNKRGSWVTFRRRLILVRRLLRGPATVAELIAAANSEQHEVYPPAAVLAVKHDIHALRDEFGCAIRYQRRQNVYTLDHPGELALLDLPDEALDALGRLDAAFADDSPVGSNEQIRLLIGRIVALLPSKRRELIMLRYALPKLEWGGRYREVIDERTLKCIERALSLQRLVSFDYRSNYDSDSKPRRYRVAPYWTYVLDGHSYLETTVIEPPADMAKLQGRAIPFRLDRIVVGSARMLHEERPQERPPQPVFRLVYELAPQVARNRDLSHWFPNTQVTYRDDGSALIDADATNLWHARQTLMRYIEHCRVHEPPELVEMMRQTIQKLAAAYAVAPDTSSE